MKTNTIILNTAYCTISNGALWLPPISWSFEFWHMRLGNGASLFDAMPFACVFIDAGNANKLTIQLGRHGGGSTQQLTTSFTPLINQWYQYQITRSAAGAVTVVVDGTVIAGPTSTLDPTDTPPTQLVIGHNDFWTGLSKFGDFRVWNYDRTAAELSGNGSHWIDGNDNGLLANWQFADGAGIGGVPTSTIADASWGPSDPTQHNGVIVDTNGDSDFQPNDCPVNIRPVVDVAAPLAVPRQDFGFLSQIAHLQMTLANALMVDGVWADIFDASVFDNDYMNVPGVAPETQNTQVPITRIRVLVSMPFDGIQLGDFLSISQATQKEFKVTAAYQLKEQQVMRIFFPDGKTLHLRVVAVLALHPLSSLYFNVQTVAV